MVHFHSYISVIGVMGEAAPNVPICHDLIASTKSVLRTDRTRSTITSIVARSRLDMLSPLSHSASTQKIHILSPRHPTCTYHSGQRPSTLLLVCHVSLFFVSHVLIHCIRYNAQMSDPSNEVMEKDRKVVDEVSGPGAVANKVDDRRDAPAGQERKKGAASASNPASQHGGTSLVSEPKADTPAPSMTQKKLVKMQNKLLKPAHDDGEFEDIDLGDSEQEININEWVWVGK
ncbi:hypothetical protein E4T38_00966 [Aureobasidium subglaciale]|nr:hypothetical protein E4T38_00966 [Aureobasidium subglaciale]KAI5230788.1 hypothetical protein E4T40_00967 [Aureobasidium subglaciale]KAI5233829.1 hypothetical protein E4T41_00965 [Aureobasidium subglaciale]KAI5267262.1 hypothetical protein E4T46_00965 [Aureobasidium subglaciale]